MAEISEELSTNIPKEITFSHENQQIVIGIQDFNAMFADIQRYNDRFSLGSMMSGLLHNLVRDDSEEPARYDEETQQLTASGMHLVHMGTLEKVGLNFEPVPGKYARMIGGGESVGEGELRINITDRQRFLGFLKAISPYQIKDGELGPNLQTLSNILTRQIFDHYDLKEPTDEALQLLGSLEGIVNEYKRLEIPGADKLETYLTHSKKGDLREYVTIERHGLLTEPEKSYGPATWQRDASRQFLSRSWNQALEILHKTQENPNAKELYNQLYGHLQKCLNFALKDMDRLAEHEAYDKEYLDKLRPVFEEVKLAFG